MIKLMLIAGAGGFVGTCARFGIVRLASMVFGGTFPAGVFIVNVLGCFIIGLLMGAVERATAMTAAQMAFLITGFCGGFTTFSTYTADIVALADRGAWLQLTAYLAGTVVLGITVFLAGRAITR